MLSVSKWTCDVAGSGFETYGTAQNQPFVDGNERTGLVAALVFLDLNGVGLDQPTERL